MTVEDSNKQASFKIDAPGCYLFGIGLFVLLFFSCFMALFFSIKVLEFWGVL